MSLILVVCSLSQGYCLTSKRAARADSRGSSWDLLSSSFGFDLALVVFLVKIDSSMVSKERKSAASSWFLLATSGPSQLRLPSSSEELSAYFYLACLDYFYSYLTSRFFILNSIIIIINSLGCLLIKLMEPFNIFLLKAL